jgi:uncharacterized protein
MQSLATNRCGDCNLCCLLTAVPELAKPVRSWCHNCSEDGCKIYQNRPQSCKNYFCLWYVNEWMGESLRPDKCGVIFEKLVDSTTYLVLVAPDRITALNSPKVVELALRLVKEGSAVVAIVPNFQPRLILPEGKTQQEVVSEINHALAMAKAEMKEAHGSPVLH